MAKALLVAILLGTAGMAPLLAQEQTQGQTPKSPAVGGTPDRAAAYYHYSLAHMFADQAGIYGNRGDYVNRAIENYKLAIQEDPASPVLTEELSDLYIQAGRLRDAMSDAEEALKQNPNDLGAHRLLARVFTRQIGDGRSGKIDETALHRAIDQYQIIATLAPMDTDALLMLARLQKASDNSVEAEKAYKRVLAIDPDNEDALTGLALVYSDLGDTRKAADLLKTLADKNPSARSLQALAAAYEQMLDFKLAAQTIRKLLELNPPNEADLTRNLAQDLAASDDLDGALAIYQKMAAEDPSDGQAFLRMSQIYMQQRQYAKAREMNDKAKALDPTSLEVRNNEAYVLEAEDRIPEAETALKDILASTAKRNYNQKERDVRAGLLERLGRLYQSVDQTEPAVAAFRQVGELDSSFGPRAAAEVIETYRGGKEFSKAQEEADAAYKKWPDDLYAVGAHAALIADLGHVDEAAAELKKLLGVKAGDNSDFKTYTALANVYDKGKRFGDMAKALDAAEKLSENDRDKEETWFARGAMYERTKKIDLAEKEFRKVLAANPGNPGALNYLGYMLADANVRLQESLDLITQALDRDPGNGAYLDSLGWAQFRLGHLDDAEANLRRALEKTPRDPTVHDHLAQVLIKESKVKEAVAQWETSLKEWDTSSPSDMRPDEIAQVKSRLEAAKVRLARGVSN